MSEFLSPYFHAICNGFCSFQVSSYLQPRLHTRRDAGSVFVWGPRTSHHWFYGYSALHSKENVFA